MLELIHALPARWSGIRLTPKNKVRGRPTRTLLLVRALYSSSDKRTAASYLPKCCSYRCAQTKQLRRNSRVQRGARAGRERIITVSGFRPVDTLKSLTSRFLKRDTEQISYEDDCLQSKLLLPAVSKSRFSRVVIASLYGSEPVGNPTSSRVLDEERYRSR